MDTKLKKFNSTLVLKIVAFMLCICCVMNAGTQVITSIYKAQDAAVPETAYSDAVYNLLFADRELTQSDTYKLHLRSFAETVGHMTGSFGDGSEKAYKQWKESLTASNEEFYKTAKENIIKHVIADELMLYLSLIEDGVVVPLGMLEVTEYSGNSIDLYDYDLAGYYKSYDELCNISPDSVVSFINNKELTQKADELGADGIFQLKNYYQILTEDNYNEEEIVIESYKPGYYAFKIDDAVLKDKLVKNNLFMDDEYGSAAEFTKSYKMYKDILGEKYPSGRYYIRDTAGRVYTNVKGLDKKSSREEITKSFAALGFYCEEKEYGSIFLPDGSFYARGHFYSHSEYDEDVTYGTTTTLPTTEYAVTTLKNTAEAVTSAVAVPTTMHIDAYDATPFVNENGEEWTCMLGVDRTSADYPETDRFLLAASQIETAHEILTDAFYTVGVLGTLFILCFIYLVARSGRRKGDGEIHLLKTDAMFTDLRIAIDGLLGFGVFLLYVSAIDEFVDSDRNVFTRISGVLLAVFTAIVLDLVLFIARHIKARNLFKNVSLVWLIRKSFGSCKSRVSAVKKLYKEKIKAPIDEKLLYTRDFQKGTLIRIGIVAAVNVALIFFGVIEAIDNYTCVLLVLCAVFDLGVLLWVIRFIGGLHKILSTLDEIRQGNYSVYINIYALPKTLRESAEKVMSLRDGLKAAVDEAVRQEQTKTELITNVSHDLKTPLTSIINYVELLKKCNITDADAGEYLDVLGEKSDRLKKLIEDLVEASKASTGNIKTEIVEVSLNEMVNQLLGEHADGLEKKKLNVIAEFPENPLTVKADGKLLYRVMENLIVNVEKYSLYGTRVYVTVKSEGDYGTVTFKNISEQPLNITADQLKERFVRGDESRSTEGNGLGLSIAQSLCDVQDGELEISISGDLFTAVVKLKK